MISKLFPCFISHVTTRLLSERKLFQPPKELFLKLSQNYSDDIYEDDAWDNIYELHYDPLK